MYIHIHTYIYHRLYLPSTTPVDPDTNTDKIDLTDFTFITQSFFMCWRALHLGIYICLGMCIR
jgi:hypothetical protein